MLGDMKPDLLELNICKMILLLEMVYTRGYLNGMKILEHIARGKDVEELTFDNWFENFKL